MYIIHSSSLQHVFLSCHIAPSKAYVTIESLCLIPGFCEKHNISHHCSLTRTCPISHVNCIMITNFSSSVAEVVQLHVLCNTYILLYTYISCSVPILKTLVTIGVLQTQFSMQCHKSGCDNRQQINTLFSGNLEMTKLCQNCHCNAVISYVFLIF